MTAVAFVAPYGALATLRFARAIATTPGARCGLITQEPLERLAPETRSVIAGHWRVDDALDPGQLVKAVAGLASQIGRVERITGILEQAQVPIAEARQALGLPGMDAPTARRFRDKALMKSVLREAGVPCARHALAATLQEALRFAEATRYPLVVKPPAGAGAKATFRIEHEQALRQVFAVMAPAANDPLLLEEFMTGREFSFDAVFLDGLLAWHSFSHYHPSPLHVLENDWIQWCVLLPRDISGPAYERAREVATAAVQALGLRTGVAHLEWFLRPDGSVAISEVGARPPGAQFSSLISYAHDADFYKAWANLVVHDRFEALQRRYAVAAVYLRGQGGARIAGVEGLDAAQADIGPLVVEANLPKAGQTRSGTYEGDGYVIVRHEDTAVVERAVGRIFDLVRVQMA